MATYKLKLGHARTFLLDVPRRPGEHVEVADPDSLSKDQQDVLAAHFICVDGDKKKKPPKAADAPKTLRNGLTEEQARQRLQAAGVAFAQDLEGDTLADLFDRQFAAGGGSPANPPPKEEDGKQTPEKPKG
jgi:hypothetical protein